MESFAKSSALFKPVCTPIDIAPPRKAIAFSRLVAHYNPGGKPGPIKNNEINDLSIKVGIISRSVPLPTPYSKPIVPGLIDEDELNKQVEVALKLLRSQVERTPIHARCGFNWPD